MTRLRGHQSQMEVRHPAVIEVIMMAHQEMVALDLGLLGYVGEPVTWVAGDLRMNEFWQLPRPMHMSGYQNLEWSIGECVLVQLFVYIQKQT